MKKMMRRSVFRNGKFFADDFRKVGHHIPLRAQARDLNRKIYRASRDVERQVIAGLVTDLPGVALDEKRFGFEGISEEIRERRKRDSQDKCEVRFHVVNTEALARRRSCQAEFLTAQNCKTARQLYSEVDTESLAHQESSDMNESPNPNLTSRREFIKNTGSLAAASALAGVTLPHVHAAENNTINIVLVGCGGRGTGAAGNAMSTKKGPVKLVAMADVFENRLRSSYEGLKSKFADKMDVPEDHKYIGFDEIGRAHV